MNNDSDFNTGEYTSGTYTQSTPSPMIGSYTEDDIRTFVGGSADSYLSIFRRIENGEKPYNIFCAFFTCHWMIYRKMWKIAVPLGIGLGLANSVTKQLGTKINLIYSLLFLIASFWYLGKNSYQMYWNHVKSEIDRINAETEMSTDEERKARLAKAGGTSLLWLFLLLLAVNVASRIFV